MNINIEGDRITVEDSKIDIYGAVELGKALAALKADGGGSVKVDLSRVERLSMPAVQVLVSAAKSFDDFSVTEAPLSERLRSELASVGVSLR